MGRHRKRDKDDGGTSKAKNNHIYTCLGCIHTSGHGKLSVFGVIVQKISRGKEDILTIADDTGEAIVLCKHHLVDAALGDVIRIHRSEIDYDDGLKQSVIVLRPGMAGNHVVLFSKNRDRLPPKYTSSDNFSFSPEDKKRIECLCELNLELKSNHPSVSAVPVTTKRNWTTPFDKACDQTILHHIAGRPVPSITDELNDAQKINLSDIPRSCSSTTLSSFAHLRDVYPGLGMHSGTFFNLFAKVESIFLDRDKYTIRLWDGTKHCLGVNMYRLDEKLVGEVVVASSTEIPENDQYTIDMVCYGVEQYGSNINKIKHGDVILVANVHIQQRNLGEMALQLHEGQRLRRCLMPVPCDFPQFKTINERCATVVPVPEPHPVLPNTLNYAMPENILEDADEELPLSQATSQNSQTQGLATFLELQSQPLSQTQQVLHNFEENKPLDKLPQENYCTAQELKTVSADAGTQGLSTFLQEQSQDFNRSTASLSNGDHDIKPLASTSNADLVMESETQEAMIYETPAVSPHESEFGNNLHVGQFVDVKTSEDWSDVASNSPAVGFRTPTKSEVAAEIKTMKCSGSDKDRKRSTVENEIDRDSDINSASSPSAHKIPRTKFVITGKSNETNGNQGGESNIAIAQLETMECLAPEGKEILLRPEEHEQPPDNEDDRFMMLSEGSQNCEENKDVAILENNEVIVLSSDSGNEDVIEIDGQQVDQQIPAAPGMINQENEIECIIPRVEDPQVHPNETKWNQKDSLDREFSEFFSMLRRRAIIRTPFTGIK